VAILDVPFLPQTEALCGGAAAAMLFRYWGEPHASVQQFAPLVDRRAGGIADAVLIDAIRQRHWIAERLDGSMETLRREVAARRPSMLLIEDRPQRYHYVVIVGIDDRGVIVHDPAWGPSRRLSFEKLQTVWKPSGFWTLRVTPDPAKEPRTTTATNPVQPEPEAAVSTPGTACDEQLNAALDQLAAQGLSAADAVLLPLAERCPADSRPLSELAAVRFTQRRWAESARLASAALARNANDGFGADVLGSSRFMLNDFDGALRAWNLVGKPTLDSIRISGLSRTRYSLLTEALDLPPDSRLTADAFRLARRRVQSLPDIASSRVGLRPADDGFTAVDIAVVERATLPRNAVQWAAASLQTALERELSANLSGRTGQGETWSAAWGWWENRPRASIEFAAPRVARPIGVWRVGLAWEAQSYGATNETLAREERLTGDAAVSNWLMPNLRLQVSAGVDAWQLPAGGSMKTVHATAAIEQRAFDDRVATEVSVGRWIGAAGGPGFGTIGADLSFRSRREPGQFIVISRAGTSAASSGAPFALWSGAGEGRGRGPLLRAHTLLNGGRIDGPVFGRTLVHATVELQHWLERPTLVRLGGAAFADVAAAGHRPVFATGRPSQVDAGVGVRIRVPGRSGTFRIDYARGVRDGARAWVVGWQAAE
jgi:predicted double-glycine peptidase